MSPLSFRPPQFVLPCSLEGAVLISCGCVRALGPARRRQRPVILSSPLSGMCGESQRDLEAAAACNFSPPFHRSRLLGAGGNRVCDKCWNGAFAAPACAHTHTHAHTNFVLRYTARDHTKAQILKPHRKPSQCGLDEMGAERLRLQVYL